MLGSFLTYNKAVGMKGGCMGCLTVKKEKHRMIRRIIEIDQEKCNGCGLCVTACHEGAIALIGGKAYLAREHYCDGLGDCLPGCPTGAITFVEREAPAYDEAAVLKAKAEKAASHTGCPGLRLQNRQPQTPGEGSCPSQLQQWPVQIKLVPVQAPWFENADVLVAADCTAYAYGDFHRDFLRGKTLLVGCPKLDAVDYSEKLTKIFAANSIRSVSVLRMEVPCCGGLERAVKTAIAQCGREIPLTVTTITTDGNVK